MYSKEASCDCPENNVKTSCKKVNNWQVFLKEYRFKHKEEHKGKSAVEVVKLASQAYKLQKNEGNKERGKN